MKSDTILLKKIFSSMDNIESCLNEIRSSIAEIRKKLD
jgi:hypothetical protein